MSAYLERRLQPPRTLAYVNLGRETFKLALFDEDHTDEIEHPD